LDEIETFSELDVPIAFFARVSREYSEELSNHATCCSTMATALMIAIGYLAFILAGLSISHAAWPRLGQPLKIVSSLLLGAVLLLCHAFALISTRSGITLGGLVITAIFWGGVGALVYLASARGILHGMSERARDIPVISDLAGLSPKHWIAILAAMALVLSLIVMPLIIRMETHLPWRYRAYLLALLGTALVGAVLRKKLLAVVIGIGLVLLPSLLLLSMDQYPVGMPLLRANAMIQEGLRADLPFFGEAGIDQVLGLLAPFALATDVAIVVLSVAFIAISGVVLSNALANRGTGRTPLALLLVFLLLIPGLLFPYVYALAVGGMEFTASLGTGALKGYGMVETIQSGELSNETLVSLRESLVSAGESFSRSETLLLGLEQLRLFGFIGSLPALGGYSATGRGLAWGLSDAANGLQTSALGILDLLGGVLTAFGASGGDEIDTFDLLGPRILEQDLNESDVSEGIGQIDMAFGQVRLGFPKIRSSIGNFSKVDPTAFESSFPDIADGLEEVVASTQELEVGIEVAEVFLSDRTNPTAATHFIYAAYSIAKIAPNLTDLRDTKAMPSFDPVVSNLSYVSAALEDPAVVEVRSSGGDVGQGIDFVADTIDLITQIADLGEYALTVAESIDGIRERFEDKEVQNFTDVEIAGWSRDAESLVQDAENLGYKLETIEDTIASMVSRATEGKYGYANELATSGIEMLEEVLDFIDGLRDLEDFAYGLRSLVKAMASFKDFHDRMVRLDRQIAASNLEGALQIAREARDDLREGRLLTEELLERIEEVSNQIQLPITEEDAGRVVDAAANIELKMNALIGELAENDQEGSEAMMSEIRDAFATLAEELRLSRLI
jgi:hypothetical protein